jgi:hypothetical protein
MPMPGGPYADKLRHAIDTGRTRSKISYPDPAAAPLGTDEEAAGTPLPGWLVERTLRAEIRRPPQPSPEAPGSWGAALLVIAGLALVAALAWLIL